MKSKIKYLTVETKWFCNASHCLLMPAKIQRFQKPYVIRLCPSHGNNVTHLSFLISHTTTSNVPFFSLILKWPHDFPRHPLYINNSRRVRYWGGRRWCCVKRMRGKSGRWKKGVFERESLGFRGLKITSSNNNISHSTVRSKFV